MSSSPAPLSGLNTPKNINQLAGILSPFVNMKIAQANEADRRIKDVKSIYTQDMKKKKPPLKSIKLPSLASAEEDELASFAKLNSSTPVELSPLKHSFIAAYGNPKRNTLRALDPAKPKHSPRLEQSPFFV